MTTTHRTTTTTIVSLGTARARGGPPVNPGGCAHVWGSRAPDGPGDPVWGDPQLGQNEPPGTRGAPQRSQETGTIDLTRFSA